jgi:hypothetical protein
MHEPYISFICGGRNDNYGGNGLWRAQVCITALLEQIERNGLDSELVFVEWNPVPNKPHLWQALDWPKDLQHCSVRVIEVPPEIHNQHSTADKIPYYIVLASNVGARRAKGEFFLSTNQDIIFSNELMDFLAQRELRNNIIYRIDRFDVPKDIPGYESLDKQLEFCYNNMGHGHCHKCDDTPHSSGAGDFILMGWELWYKIGGFYETSMYPVYVDGLMVNMAFHMGDGQVILRPPMYLYHIEHENSWISLGEGVISERGLPFLTYNEYRDLCRKIAQGERPISNYDDWGLRDVELAEHHIGGPL